MKKKKKRKEKYNKKNKYIKEQRIFKASVSQKYLYNEKLNFIRSLARAFQ
jgi:hypothetical protein